jgi:hypothetical protein
LSFEVVLNLQKPAVMDEQIMTGELAPFDLKEVLQIYSTSEEMVAGNSNEVSFTPPRTVSTLV